MSLKGHPDSQLKQCNADTLQEEAPYVSEQSLVICDD